MAAPVDERDWASTALSGHRTLAEKAFTALHEGIVTGGLAPGQRLRIEDLAETLGMSHLPIREAIRRLESVGLVEHVPHRGARVTELSLTDLSELYEARLQIEPALIEHAARRFSETDAEAAQRWLDRQAEAEQRGDLREVWSSHTEFHFALYRPSESRWLLRLSAPLWESSQRYRLTMAPLNSERRRKEAHAEHLRMLAACVDHDPGRASLVLHNHLVRTANLIVDQMGGGPDAAFPLLEEPVGATADA